MELENLEQITPEGLHVFMPSGTDATLYKDNDFIIVEYPELYRDKYTREQFTKLMEEGIQIMNPPSQEVMESKKEPTLLEQFIAKGYIRPSLAEAYEKAKRKEGDVFKAMNDKDVEYLTPEFKNELLTMLDEIAKAYPDVKIRQQATTFMDALGLQEYYGTKAMKDFANKYIKLLHTHVNESVNEAALKPFRFTVDYGDSRPEDFIAYGLDAEDAKRDLYDEYSYLKKHDIKITNVEEVPEDHEEVTLPFTMIHRSSEGPDASGEVTFFPTAFGYEYQCTEKDFNGRGPKWSTIRTIEGIKIWFRNVLFEFGAKTVTIGDETWDIDDFPKNEALNEIKEITKAEWDKTPNDYKMIRNGQKYIMYLDPKQGTVLAPCKIVDKLNEEDDKFNYMLLARLKQDCGYFLGNGNGYEPHLWAGNVEDQIAKMKELYNKVPEKPEWLSLEDIDKYEKDMLAKRDSKDESVNEEQGPYFENDAIGQIAAEIEAGNKSGYEPTEFGNWILITNMDTKWEAITEPAKDFLLEKIAILVADGNISKDNVEIDVNEDCGIAKDDLASLNVFSDEQLDDIFIQGNEDKFEISFELQFDGQLGESFKVKKCKKDKKKLDEVDNIDYFVKSVEGENGPFASREAAANYITQQVLAGKNEADFEIITNNGEEKMEEHKKAPELVTESYKVYNTVGAEVAGENTFNSWEEVNNFLQQEWGTYKASMIAENPEFGTEEDEGNFLGNYEVEIIEVPAEMEVQVNPDVCPECGETECICEPAEVCPECGCEPCECEKEVLEAPVDVVEDFEDEHIGKSDDEQEEVEETEEVVTPEQAAEVIDKVEDAIDSLEDFINMLVDDEELTQEEQDEISALEPKDEALTDYNTKQDEITLKECKKQFEKLVADAADKYWQGYKFIDITLLEVHCPAFTNINWEDIPELIRSWGYAVVEDPKEEEPAISLIKDATEEDVKEMVKEFNIENGFDESLKEDTTVLDNGKEFKVDDKAFDIVRKNLLDVMRGYGWVDVEQMQDYIKEEGLELTDEELIAVAKTCLKYTRIFDASELQDTDLQDIKDAYGTVIVVGNFKRLPKNEEVKPEPDPDEPKNEGFKDGMLTDVKDLDMPDAIAQAIDVNDDGTVMRLTDIMAEVKALKSEMEKALVDFKTDMKDILNTVKQDIQRDVNDVENKVDDTQDAVDDLVVEEEGVEEELPPEEETTEPAEEVPAEKQEEQEPEEVEEAYEPTGNVIIDTTAQILREEKVSLQGLYKKLSAKGIAPTPLTKTLVEKYITTNKLSKTLLKEEEDESLISLNDGEIKSKDPAIKKFCNKGVLEDLVDTKKKADEVIAQGGTAQDVKNAIDMYAADDNEAKQAKDYAINKMKESLLNTKKNSKLSIRGILE